METKSLYRNRTRNILMQICKHCVSCFSVQYFSVQFCSQNFDIVSFDIPLIHSKLMKVPLAILNRIIRIFLYSVEIIGAVHLIQTN